MKKYKVNKTISYLCCMQTQSFLTQTPLFQGFPLLKRKHKEEFWVSTWTEVPVFAAETPSQMLGEDHTNQLKSNTLAFEEIPHLTLGEGDKGGEDSTKIWEPATHKSFVIGQKSYEIQNNIMKTEPTKYDIKLVLKQKKELDQFIPHFVKDLPRDRPV